MPLHLKDIKKGQRFYESERGQDFHAEAMEDAHEVNDANQRGWACAAKSVESPQYIVDYFEAHDAGAYRLNLYDRPQYFAATDDAKV